MLEWRPQMRLFTALPHSLGVSTRAVSSVAQRHWVRADVACRQGSHVPGGEPAGRRVAGCPQQSEPARTRRAPTAA